MDIFLKVLLIILVILVIALIVLYFVGRRLQKKQAAQQEQMEAAKQTVSMLIIDKKMMPIKQSGLPQMVIDQTPKLDVYKRQFFSNVLGTFNFVFLSLTKPIQPQIFPAAFSVNNFGPRSVNSPIIVTFFLISIIRSNISNFCPVEPSFAKEKSFSVNRLSRHFW